MPAREVLIGSWTLESAHLLRNGAATTQTPFGTRPNGVLHYLPDGRVAVLIAHEGRPVMTGDRLDATDAEWARAARSFTGYAGRWTVDGDRVVHHVDLNSYQKEVDADYHRIAHCDGDRLTLITPPDLPEDQRPMQLIWRRWQPPVS